MERRNVDVCNVHRHLSYAIFVDIPAEGLGTFQRAGLWRTAFLSHIEGNGIGNVRVGSIEVEVHGDEEVTGTNDGAASTGHAFIEH